VTTKFKAHDETNAYHAGDRVVIEETRPLSRGKRWRIVGKANARTNADRARTDAEKLPRMSA
jgi:small subunit ribosomal protein S17